MNWQELKSESDLAELISKSFETKYGVAIFKHSTRCSISEVAKTRLKSFWDFNDDLPIYYLDLLSYREISNKIAEQFSIHHESPQILIIKNGECIYNASHMAISVKSIKDSI